MRKYPRKELESLAGRIQSLLGEYRGETTHALTRRISPEESSRLLLEASDNLMKKAGTKALPQIQKVLAEIEVALSDEDKVFAKRIRPILSEAQQFARFPTNPLGYAELSTLLMRLAGYMSVTLEDRPTVFVGYQYTEDDEPIADWFIKLISQEGFEPTSGKKPKAQAFDEKVKRMIARSEGVVVIFTKEKELRERGWTTPTWLTDEKAFAIGKDKPIALFFEDCIAETETKGIQGLHEHIKFNRKHLDKARPRIVKYLRDFKRRILGSDE